MNELQLLGPRAYGEPLGSAVLKAIAEDFQVDEVLDIPFSGDGEHLWIWVEKRGLNTEEAARRIAKAAGVPLRELVSSRAAQRKSFFRQSSMTAWRNEVISWLSPKPEELMSRIRLKPTSTSPPLPPWARGSEWSSAPQRWRRFTNS
jgi:hypothetical protein